MKTGKVKNMIDAFSSFAARKEKSKLMNANLDITSKVNIGKGIHNKVTKSYYKEYKELGIKLNNKLTPQGDAFPNEMAISNIIKFEYQINKAKKERIEMKEAEKQATKQNKKKKAKK